MLFDGFRSVAVAIVHIVGPVLSTQDAKDGALAYAETLGQIGYGQTLLVPGLDHGHVSPAAALPLHPARVVVFAAGERTVKAGGRKLAAVVFIWEKLGLPVDQMGTSAHSHNNPPVKIHSR
jgi:hypothetical protein